MFKLLNDHAEKVATIRASLRPDQWLCVNVEESFTSFKVITERDLNNYMIPTTPTNYQDKDFLIADFPRQGLKLWSWHSYKEKVPPPL